MTDGQTARALWLSLGDPFRMGWPALGGGVALLVPYLFPMILEIDAVTRGHQTLSHGALFIAYWLCMASGVTRLLGENRSRRSNTLHTLTIVGMAFVVLVLEGAIQFLFDAVIWPSGFALTGAAFHLALLLVAFVKDACMVRVALGQGADAAVAGLLAIVRNSNLVIAYALLFLAAFLLNPWGSPWIGSIVMSLLGLRTETELLPHISLAASLYLTLCMTALVARGPVTRGLGPRA